MEENIINKGNKDKFLFKILICLVLLLIIFLLPKYSNKSFAAEQEESPEFVYLSDIQYSSAKVGWGKINLDGTDSGAEFSIKIEGGTYNFRKGIWAHASSEIVYNLTDYQDYDYFTTYMGVNTTSGNRGNGVKFYIYTSTDGKQWNLKTEAEPQAIMSSNDAIFVKIDITDAKFLKLVAKDNGSNGNDHSVYVDAKLIKETYKEPGEELVPSIEKLDQKIKNEFANANLETDPEYELTLLKRELVDRVGNYALRKFLNASEENKETYSWLTSNLDVLRLYILGGTPDGGSYFNSLTQLSRLYNEYKDDFTLTEKLNNNWYPDMTYGDLYKKMAISLSLTHSQNLGLWMQAGAVENKSDALKRYAIYKYMHKNGKFRATDNLDITPWFEALHVEEMRFVMNNLIDDEEILWLNAYVQDRLDQYKTTNWLTPHPYIAYVWPNYGNTVYYDEENRQYFNELFAINKKDDNKGEELTNESGEKTGKIGLWDTKFTIPGGKNTKSYEISVTRGTSEYKLYKVWMNFRNKFGTGCVCGGISKSGSNIRTTHGIPATVIGQPGHAALLCYSKNNDGQGYWGIDNDVSGWTLSEKGERMLLGWGNASYSRGYSVVYMVLAQEAINDFENLVKCEEQVYLAKVYSGNLKKQEEIYEKALEIQPINIDAWFGLINVYNQSKTEDECYELTERLAENLKCFPLPMQHLTNLIKPKLTSVENTYKFTLLQTRILEEGSKLSNTATDQVLQPGITRVEANYLLGKLDKTIATFSFDGDDAGKIVLSSRFDGNGIRFDYCLTGKGENESWQNAEWHEVSFTAEEEHKLQLTQKEIAKITAENDIYIHIVGVNYDEENLYKIDITQQAFPNTLYANDWENKVIGATETVEWRYTKSDAWTSYSVASPDLTGNKTVQVRIAATGTKLASPASELYTFTEDNWTDTRKYIPIEHLSIHSYSTQSTDTNRPYYAPNSIDGNINTMWHTDFAQNVLQQSTKPFIVIELDEPRNISALEFVQGKWRDSDPVYIKNAIIYASNDGKTWIEAGRTENCEQNLEFKSVEFDESVYAKYIKFEMDTYNMFSSLAMVNLFEDKTKITLANFSFNGEDAGKIVLLDEYKAANWEYSLDGGKTWKQRKEDSYELTEIELKQINIDDNIKVRLNGKESTIVIKKQDAPNISAYLNDLENRLIGINNIDNLEWKIEGNANWTSYSEKEPIVLGNKKLLIRKKALGTLMASDAVEFTFTEDNYLDTARYVSIKHLSIESFSSTTANRGEPATNAIDALPTTMWHTNRVTTTMKDPRWIVIELDEPRYISKIEYVRKAEYAYGILKNGIVSISMDGENWEVAHNIKDLYNVATVAELTASENSKDIVFAESKQAKYIKIECTESCDYVHGNRNGVPMDYFFSAAMFNIFEDITKAEYPTAEIEYSTTQLTNKDVTATLVNENMDITVINNNGSKTYTFTENGTFTFEFINSKGIKGTATAEVNNIDKTMPNAKIEYSTEELTNGNVIATVTFDKKDVTITNNEGNNTYTFTENGEFTFEFIGPAGNAGTAIAKVSWIDKTAPIATIKYSAEYKTNQDIVATITFNKEDVTITNNEGKNTYTFTDNGTFTFNFVDKAGNTATATATVANIDKNLPKATVTYDINKLTNQNVIATITFDKENVTITNNNGSNTYTFIENGKFTFEFVGPSGNAGIVVAEVNWIDKTAPKATITYDIDNKLTNQDVKATITFNEENVRIINNNGSNAYTFTLNGTFTFRFEDMAGNEAAATAQVEWIDKTVPVATITYDINDITNKDVKATVTFDKIGVIIVNEQGEEIENGETYVFKENGTHEFKYIGPAGNTGTAIAKVSWIDKIPPEATITYDIGELTNKNVTAKVTFDEGGVTIINEQGEKVENGDTYIFTQNGSYTFNYIGPLGNTGTATAVVNWIDKTSPTAQINYSTVNLTNKDVTATLVNASEDITITNNNGSSTYIFTDNGTFTFEYVDKVGNKGKSTAIVSNIDKKVPNATITYSTEEPTNKDVKATITFDKENVKITNNEGNNTYTFTKNGEFTFEFEDEAGNKSTVKTKVDWITKEQEIPNPDLDSNQLGDINKDEKITATDLLLLKRHLVAGEKQEWVLTENKFVAGDINKDGKITATDLILMKRLVLNKIDTH